MKNLLLAIVVIICILLFSVVTQATKVNGIKEGKRIEKAEFLAGTSIPKNELSTRVTEKLSANYIFYDETYAQVVSIYSDLKTSEVIRLTRYIYPKECRLILINIKPVATIGQELNKLGIPIEE